MKERIALIALILFIAAISLFLSTKVVITQPSASPSTTAPPSL